MTTRRTIFVALAAIAVAAGALAFQRRDRFAGPSLSPPDALKAVQAGEIILVDIRRPEEWAATGVPKGAIPLDMRREDFVSMLDGLVNGDRARPVALICAAGRRSDYMGGILKNEGFTRVMDVDEGMMGSAVGPGWIKRGLAVDAVK